MPRRIFLALPISEALHEPIADWKRHHRDLPVRWLALKNLHITILPPWTEEDAPTILERLKMAEGLVGPLELVFTGIAYGPNSREPRLIWAEGEAPDQIFGLKHNVERVLSRTPNNRPFRLHMTLARFPPEDFSKFSKKKLIHEVEWHDAVDSFTLMESRMSPRGADYEVLVKFLL